MRFTIIPSLLVRLALAAVAPVDKDFRHRSMRQPRRTTYPLVDLPPMRPR